MDNYKRTPLRRPGDGATIQECRPDDVYPQIRPDDGNSTSEYQKNVNDFWAEKERTENQNQYNKIMAAPLAALGSAIISTEVRALTSVSPLADSFLSNFFDALKEIFGIEDPKPTQSEIQPPPINRPSEPFSSARDIDRERHRREFERYQDKKDRDKILYGRDVEYV